MEVLQESVGRNGATIFSDGNGFWYRVSKKKLNSWHVRCIKSNCRGTGKIILPIRNLEHMLAHTCEPNIHHSTVAALKRRIMERSREEITPLSHIFLEETTRRDVNPEVAAQLSFASMESAMFKARRRTGAPLIPNSVVDFVNEAQAHPENFLNVNGESFLSGVVGEGEEIAAIFLPTQLQNILVSSEEWHLDATYKTVPTKPKLRQLFTIMAVFNNQALPIVFCLMTSKTAALYVQIFQHLVDKIPNLQQPRIIISDYEAAIKTAVSTVFPESKQSGCWFHFAQCIYRKVQKLGMANLYRNCRICNKCVQMVIALALLPHERIEEGMYCVESVFDVEATAMEENDRRNMMKLFRYVRIYWIEKVGTSSFSVFRQMNRTNNCQESFHGRLKKLAGATAHPNIWSFQGCLVKLAKEAVVDSLRLDNGSNVRRPRKMKWLLQDRAIQDAETKLMADPPQLDTLQFLSTLAYRCTTRQPTSGSSDEDDGDDELVSFEVDPPVEPVDPPVEPVDPPVHPAPNEDADPEEERRNAIAQQREKLRAINVALNDVESSHEVLACITCCTMQRSYSFEPCGHFALCGRCCIAHRESQDDNFVTCVVCRCQVTGYKPTFFT